MISLYNQDWLPFSVDFIEKEKPNRYKCVNSLT